MKTTLNLQESLVVHGKTFAALQGITLTRLIEEGLAMRLAKGTAKPKPRRIVLPTFDGKTGFVKGIKSNSNQAIYQALEQ